MREGYGFYPLSAHGPSCALLMAYAAARPPTPKPSQRPNKNSIIADPFELTGSDRSSVELAPPRKTCVSDL